VRNGRHALKSVAAPTIKLRNCYIKEKGRYVANFYLQLLKFRNKSGLKLSTVKVLQV
jgi:hypothetical protein